MRSIRTRSLGMLMLKIFLSSSTVLFSQTDYSWWNLKHNWDGTSRWVDYMTMSPAYLGPNALPVPEFHGPVIPNQHEVSLGTEIHHSSGDNTTNLFCSYSLPLFTEKVSISLDYRPVEIYRTDTITRDLRASRQFNPEGYSLGDLYVTTHIQVLKDLEKWPDLSIGIGIKTASGTNLDGARHTDTPGYWFELGTGKLFPTALSKLRSISVYARAGFYSYQIYDGNRRQNDAMLYGAGIDLVIGKLKFQHQLTGYYGYFNNGDHPLVYRLILQPAEARKTSAYLMVQQGVHDYEYTSIRVALVLHFKGLWSFDDSIDIN